MKEIGRLEHEVSEEILEHQTTYSGMCACRERVYNLNSRAKDLKSPTQLVAEHLARAVVQKLIEQGDIT